MNDRITYRREVDGLRAIAVLSVVFFHAGFAEISGGYVGVDIFFVISGFLITSLIFKELKSGHFSFKNFWLRRARRILPAASVMMLVTAAVFAFYYPTTYYDDFGKSLIAQTFFSANILFWKQGGYFATAQELKPLLHTWSLAVEEQFYMLFPFFFWAVFTFLRSALVPAILIGCGISIGLSVYAAEYHPIPAFYLLPFRAWELGVGALLAITQPHFYSSSPRVNNLVSATGLIAILWSMFFFDEKTPFPSYTAALPVLGTAAIIWADTNMQTVVGKFFSLKPIVGIGLISYSLYLWHWPIFVLNSWVYHADTNDIHRLLALALAAVLAYVSYKWVETPIRKNRLTFTNKRVVIISILSSAFAASLGLMILLFGNGFVVDPDGQINQYYQAAMKPEPNRKDCLDLYRNKSGKISCQYLNNPSTDSIDLFVWGDSHGSALIPAFDRLSKDYSYNLEFSVTLGCQPVIGMRRVDSFQHCAEVNSAVLNHIKDSNFPLVVLVGSFVNNVSQGKLRDINSEKSYDAKKALGEFGNRIVETVSAIKSSGAKVLVFTEPPRASVNPVSDYLRKKTLRMDFDEFLVERSSHMQRITPVYRLIDAANIDGRLDYTDHFCNDIKCRALIDGMSLYKDGGHISVFGAEQIAPLIGADIKALELYRP